MQIKERLSRNRPERLDATTGGGPKIHLLKLTFWNSCFDDFLARIRRPMKADYLSPRTSLIKWRSAFDRSAEGPARLEAGA